MKALFLVCLMLLMTGCAAIETGPADARVPIQFALLKTIQENPDITPAFVMSETARYRQAIQSNPSINIKALLADAFIRYGIEVADPEDQAYLRLLFLNIERAVNETRLDIPANEARLRLLTLLDWIDQAARLADSS